MDEPADGYPSPTETIDSVPPPCRDGRVPVQADTPVPALPPAAGLEYPMLCLRPTAGRGLGVFALRRFRPGEVVERARAIVLPSPQWELLNRTALQHYYYSWEGDTDALVFGFGAFYNHAQDPNVLHVRRHAEQVMEYIALRDIAPGEEITIRYRCPLWFDPA